MPDIFGLSDGAGYDPAASLAAPEGNTPAPGGVIPLSQMGENYYHPQDRSYSIGQHLAFAVPGTALAAVDTVGRSVGILSENSTKEFAKRLDPAGFGSYYEDNFGGLSLAGDLGTMLIPGIYGAKAMQSGSWLFKSLAKAGVSTKALDVAFASAEEGGAALRTLLSEDLLAATTKRQVLFTAGTNPVRDKLVADALKTGLADATKKYVGSEAAIFATMNQSENLYPSDLSVSGQLALHAVGLGVSGAIEAAFIKRSIRQNLRSPEAKDAIVAARNALGIEPAPSTAGSRDFQITLAALSGGEQRATRERAIQAGDTALAQNAGKLATSWDIDLKNELGKLATDKIKHIDLSANEASIRSLMGAIQRDPTIVPGLRVFGDIPTTQADFAELTQAATAQVTRLQKSLDRHADAIMRVQYTSEKMRNVRTGVTPSAERTALINSAKDAIRVLGDEALDASSFSSLVASLNEAAALYTKTSGLPLDKEMARRLRLVNRASTSLRAIDDAQEELAKYSKLSVYVAEPDGNMVLASERRLRFHDTDHPVIGTVARQGQIAEQAFGTHGPLRDPLSGTEFTPIVTADLIPQLPANKAWVDMSVFQQSAYYATGQHILEHYKPGRRLPQNLINLAEDSPAYSLDLAAHIVQRHPEAVADFNLPLAAQGNEAAWLAQRAIENKYSQIFVPLMDRWTKEQAGNTLTAANMRLTLEDMRYALNLPGKQLGSESPLFQLFRSVYIQGDRSLESAGIKAADLGRLMREEVAGLSEPAGPASMNLLSTQPQKAYATVGNNFRELRDATSGAFAKAQLLIKEPPKFNLFQQSMDTYSAARNLERLRLFSEEAPGFIRDLFGKITSTSAFQVAKFGVTTLADGQQANRGVFAYQNMATRDIDVFTAVDTVAAIAENNASRWVEQLFTRPGASGQSHYTAFLNLRRPENKGSLFTLEQFRAAKQFGFELEAGTVPDATGKYHMFKLATTGGEENPQLTGKNIAAWKKMFGEDVPLPDPANAMLPLITPSSSAMRGTPLLLDEVALSGLHAIKDVMDTLYTSTNFLRKVHGRPEVAYQNWYLPPPNLADKVVKYVVMPGEEGTGKAVKYVLYDATNSGMAKQVAHPVVQDLLRKGGQLLDQAEMGRQFDLRDQAFFNMLDFSDTLAQTGRGSGALGKQRVDYGVSVLDDLVASAESHVLSIAKRTVSSLFENELAYARHMDAMSELAKGKSSIWQQWANRLLGNKATTGTQGPLDAVTRQVSSSWDASYAKVKDSIQAIMPTHGTISSKTEKDFNTLKAALGDRLPYSSAAEFAENTFKVSRNPSLEDVSYGLNGITANLALRIFEVGNATLSLVGNLVSMPLVMNALKRSNHPTEEAWRAATGLLGHSIPNQDVALPNPARWMAKAMQFSFSKEGQQVIEEARRFGGLRGTVAEVYRTLHMPMEGEASAAVRKLVDAVSFISDKGEQLSRTWAYMGGYLLARDAYRMSSAADRHSVAMLFADNAIANFRSANKPMLFQGALGAPLGLFQTYMWNYYGRMFRYIENKDYRALTVNYALQAGVFGLESVPGWTQINSMYMSAAKGERDLIDGLDAAYGTRATDWVLHGTISNLPKVFGADGIALYSRGDANISRVPAFISPANAPVVAIAENVAGLLGESLNMFKTGGEPTMQRMAEIVGTYSPNRPLARTMELATGVSVDKRGAVIAEDTRTASSIVARLMGLRPMQEAEAIKANARNSSVELHQQEIHKRLQTNLRSAFRAGLSAEEMDTVLSDAIMAHIQAGGSPSSAAEYIKNAALAAQINRNDREFMRLMKNPSRYNEAVRLLNSMTGYRED